MATIKIVNKIIVRTKDIYNLIIFKNYAKQIFGKQKVPFSLF